MNNETARHNQADIDYLFDISEQPEATVLSPLEQKKKLREAQNVNRGHPRKGETRPRLKQINITCLHTSSEELDDISLSTGKTKRSLMEEAIRFLTRKYSHV